MSAAKRGIAGGLLAAAVMLGAVIEANGQERRGPQAEGREVRGVVKSVNATAGTITLTFSRGREAAAEEKTYTLAKNVEIAYGSGGGGRGRGGFGSALKEGKLADLAAGVAVMLSLAADLKTVDSILAEGPVVRGLLKAVDAKKNTLTITLPARREEGADEKTYTLAPDVEVVVDDGRGRRFSIKEAKTADLTPGALVTLALSIDQKQVETVLAEGQTYSGPIKSVDGAKKTLTLTVRPARGEDTGEEKILTVAPDAVVLIDDGKGRFLSLKCAKLDDVPAGAAATVKLSPDQAVAMLVRVEGPTLTGLLKAVDPDKRIIVITIPKGRGEDPEEKSLTVAKGARVTLDGTATKLRDLKPADNGPYVQARLSLDGKTVQSVMAHQARGR